MSEERQIHGFNFENQIISSFNIEKSKDYTNKWDGYLKNIPVSIKLEKFGSDIEMADYFRNQEVSENFILIVGFWKDNKDNITEINYLYIPHKEWTSLFDSSFTLKFKQLLNGISNDKEDDIRWKKEITLLRKEWSSSTPNLIRPRFKRDHKTQKRIQCAINNKDFYSYFLNKYKVSMEDLCQEKLKALDKNII